MPQPPLAQKIPALILLGLSSTIAISSHAASRVAAVTVYPGSAAIDRVTLVEAGARKVIFDCLPAGLDNQSLQIDADADVRVGEMSIKTQARNLSDCAAHPLDGRIRALEDQKAALKAENDALELVKGYLKGVWGTDEKSSRVDGKSIGSTSDALRRSGQSAFLRQYQLTQQLTELDRSLQPLLTERGRSQSAGQVKTVSASVYAPRGTTIHLHYQVRGPSWSPAYRALLDTQSNKLKIERQALVSQGTGEDWSGVKLLLSTGQPRANAVAPTPWSWQIGIAPPVVLESTTRKMAYGGAAPIAMPAPAPVAADAVSDEVVPDYTVNVANYGYTTEFNIPGNIDVPSSGERIAFSLGQTEQAAKLLVRTSPAQDASAYLMAQVTQPDGIWPQGPVQLYRDGAFVGTSTLDFNNNEVDDESNQTASKKLSLSFGRDELVRVVTEPVRDTQSTAGFTGNRRERHVTHGYVVENKHTQPIHLQILEAAPVATDDRIQISKSFEPKPSQQDWRKQPGLILWQTDLAAGQRTRVTADYTISAPKDAVLGGQ